MSEPQSGSSSSFWDNRQGSESTFKSPSQGLDLVFRIQGPTYLELCVKEYDDNKDDRDDHDDEDEEEDSKEEEEDGHNQQALIRCAGTLS